MKTLTKEVQEAITPMMALELLKEGNKRFVNNLRVNRNLLQQANDTSDGQHPFAVILSCIDSRTSAELIFDQGLGDIFSIRIAGSVINEDVLASMEFSCKVAGAKIIVVLGHTRCGAIHGACDHIEMGNLTSLLSKISPAIYEERTITSDRDSSNEEFVRKVTEINIKRNVTAIMQRSPILRDMILNRHCGLIGGNHDIATGEVTFYEESLVVSE
jgi:carbonic anhydrase